MLRDIQVIPNLLINFGNLFELITIVRLIIYTMHNKFSNFLCFASLCAHLCAMSNNFKCNDENRILGK